MAKVIIKKKRFSKVATVAVPDVLLKHAKKEGNDSVLYADVTPNRMVLTSTPNTLNVTLKNGDEVTYGKCSGFFVFRGDIFYRVKGSAGKSIVTGEAFAEYIKSKYPEEFQKTTMSAIANIVVQSLNVI